MFSKTRTDVEKGRKDYEGKEKSLFNEKKQKDFACSSIAN